MSKNRRPQLQELTTGRSLDVEPIVLDSGDTSEPPPTGSTFSLVPIERYETVSAIALKPSFSPSLPDKFDYGRLTSEGNRKLRESERRLDEIDRVAIIDKGRELLANRAMIQDELGHGHWELWLRTGRRYRLTTARNYMDAAKWAAETAIVADLAPRAIYRGARAPDEVKRDIVRRLEGGESVDFVLVCELIDAHKNAALEAARLKKLTAEERAKDPINRARREARNEKLKKKADDESKDWEQRRLELSSEVVAKLRTVFDDDDILVLLKTWLFASYAHMTRMLGAPREAYISTRSSNETSSGV